MVFSKINILKLLLIFILCFIVSFFAYNTKTTFNSNIASVILPKEIIENTSLIKILDKTSKNINVIFEADTEDEVKELKENFIEKLDKNNFDIVSYDIDKTLKLYLKSPTNFLSYKTKEKLKNKKYNEVFSNAVDSLYNPVGVQLANFEDDPYFLFNDFILSNLDLYNNSVQINNKSYSILNLAIKDEYNFNKNEINKKIEKLIKDNNNKNTYFSGSLIHSYQTSKTSAIYINIVCILSTILIIFLTYFYFRNLKLLIPIALSLIFGTYIGFCTTKICFLNFHIITLLFATTIIGIGVDYSYHYFSSGKINKQFVENLSISYISTAIAFLILFLSNIELLKQISTFIISGLFAIYLFTLFIFPIFKFNCEIKTFAPEIKNKKVVIYLLIFLSLIGIFNFKFDDSLTSLYLPKGKLKKAETIYNKIINKDNLKTNFIVIDGKNSQDLIINEEKVNEILNQNNINYISYTKFFPSTETQKENNKLVKELYLDNLDSFKEYLSKKQIQKIKNIIFNFKEVDFSPIKLDNFQLDKNKSLIIAYSNKIPSEIKYETININSDISNYLRKYRWTLLKLLPVCYLIIALCLTIIFKSKKAFKMLIPVTIASVCSFLISNIFFETNLFSIISIYLLIGFTLDYCVFKFCGDKKSSSAIFISALTTSFSFLLLSFTTFKLISSMSVVLFLGIVISYICCCFLNSQTE